MAVTPMETNLAGIKEAETAAVSVDEHEKKKMKKKILQEIHSIEVTIASI